MKKGQFYLFTGIVLATFLLAIVIPRSGIGQARTGFASLVDNFGKEEPFAVNQGIAIGDLTDTYDAFVDDFMYYARTRYPTISIFYCVADDGMLMLRNQLGEQVTVSGSGFRTTMDAGDEGSVNISRSETLSVEAGAASYELVMNSNRYQTAAIFKSQDGDNIRVRVKQFR